MRLADGEILRRAISPVAFRGVANRRFVDNLQSHIACLFPQPNHLRHEKYFGELNSVTNAIALGNHPNRHIRHLRANSRARDAARLKP
jgi:hypothetical protein